MTTYDDYIDGVLSGRVMANRWTVAACRRHVEDMKNGAARGLRFEPAAAQHAIDFFGFIKHTIGEWRGQTIVLEPWQAFIVAMLFGWRQDDGLRRFRTSYLEVARKNGKSTFAAGIGLYLLAADNEPGAEVYTAATKRDQARITHSEATRMVKTSPALRKHIKTFKDNLHVVATASKFEPLGRDSDTMDGLNVHGAIIDEFHAHPTRDVYDVLETATGARRQPLIFIITTAGYDRASVCWQFHEFSQKILDRVIADDSFFGCIYGLDDGDDWEDESLWSKANPNLGISKKWDDMRRKAGRAREMPAALNTFLRLELNLWTQASTRWVPVEHWEKCSGAVDANALRGRVCYGALDLATTTDIAAFLLVFPPADESDLYRVLCRFWVPEDAIIERSKRDRVSYDAWRRAGFITSTPGGVIDYDWILQQVIDDCSTYDVREIAYDPWNSTALINDIDKADCTTLVEFRQGYASMSAPMKYLEGLIVKHGLAHGNNPVLSWMAHNVVSTSDPAGNIKPDKSKSSEKIDGMVALIMGIGRASLHGESSVYDERGVLTI